MSRARMRQRVRPNACLPFGLSKRLAVFIAFRLRNCTGNLFFKFLLCSFCTSKFRNLVAESAFLFIFLLYLVFVHIMNFYFRLHGLMIPHLPTVLTVDKQFVRVNSTKALTTRESPNVSCEGIFVIFIIVTI
jgi:hypothetical protein